MTSRMLFICSPLSLMPARSALRIKRVFSTCALVGVTAIYLDHKSTSACANDEPFTANTGLKSAETSDNEGKKHDYDRKEPEKNPPSEADDIEPPSCAICIAEFDSKSEIVVSACSLVSSRYC